MNFLTEHYNTIMSILLITGFSIAIGVLVGVRKTALKEEFDKEMASKARKVRKVRKIK